MARKRSRRLSLDLLKFAVGSEVAIMSSLMRDLPVSIQSDNLMFLGLVERSLKIDLLKQRDILPMVMFKLMFAMLLTTLDRLPLRFLCRAANVHETKAATSRAVIFGTKDIGSITDA